MIAARAMLVHALDVDQLMHEQGAPGG